MSQNKARGLFSLGLTQEKGKNREYKAEEGRNTRMGGGTVGLFPDSPTFPSSISHVIYKC